MAKSKDFTRDRKPAPLGVNSSSDSSIGRRDRRLGCYLAAFTRRGAVRRIRKAIRREGAVRLCRHLHISGNCAGRYPPEPGEGHLCIQDEPERWRIDTAPDRRDSEPIIPRARSDSAAPVLRQRDDRRGCERLCDKPGERDADPPQHAGADERPRHHASQRATVGAVSVRGQLHQRQFSGLSGSSATVRLAQ